MNLSVNCYTLQFSLRTVYTINVPDDGSQYPKHVALLTKKHLLINIAVNRRLY
jgi:hypothetical protein